MRRIIIKGRGEFANYWPDTAFNSVHDLVSTDLDRFYKLVQFIKRHPIELNQEFIRRQVPT